MQSKKLPPRDVFPEGDKIDVTYERAQEKIQEANSLVEELESSLPETPPASYTKFF